MSSRDLTVVVKTQKAFIKELLDRLEGKETNSDRPIKNDDYMFVNIQGTDYSLSTVRNMLNDTYFNGLSFLEILELAKKSMRLTKDNCDMTHKLENLLEKAKINGDNYYVNEIIAVLKSEDF